jgi:hypothetical protein
LLKHQAADAAAVLLHSSRHQHPCHLLLHRQQGLASFLQLHMLLPCRAQPMSLPQLPLRLLQHHRQSCCRYQCWCQPAQKSVMSLQPLAVTLLLLLSLP